ncbi:MAG: DUF4476 domain-containing protein [Williamsia sp.]|nr:DUF4476 domain-containing protein [Williamsia sp.]
MLVLVGTRGLAQQQYYLYLQSSTSQPFYARIQNGIYSSSENGYMIVPKLRDSTYDIFIRFARNLFPEQHFLVDMNKQDQGFELRNLGDKGWGLFNLQNGAMIQATLPAQKQEAENTGERKSDAFSQMLANVVNDSSILYTAAKPVTPPDRRKPATTEPPQQVVTDTALAVTTTPPAEKKTDSAAGQLVKREEKKETPPEKKDSVPLPEKQVTITKPPVQEPPVTTPPKKQDAAEKPFITRISESKTEEGYKAVFIEQYIYSTDTVDVEIPLKEPAVSVSNQPVSQPPAVTQPQQKSPDTVTQRVSTPAPPASVDSATKKASPSSADTTTKKKAGLVVTNSDCKNFASDSDVDKLRVKLLAENAIDDKLVVARKYFKTKCYSVKQIKGLTELFPSDESKYRFFDAAYPFVSDTENFLSLEELISNDYYKNRFRAMIRQ